MDKQNHRTKDNLILFGFDEECDISADEYAFDILKAKLNINEEYTGQLHLESKDGLTVIYIRSVEVVSRVVFSDFYAFFMQDIFVGRVAMFEKEAIHLQ